MLSLNESLNGPLNIPSRLPDGGNTWEEGGIEVCTHLSPWDELPKCRWRDGRHDTKTASLEEEDQMEKTKDLPKGGKNYNPAPRYASTAWP